MPERNPSPLFLVPPAGLGRPPARGDGEMVAAYLAGERWAAEAIWERHAPQVRRMVMRALGPGPGVEDLVQDAFLRLYRKLPQLRDGAALPAFVVTITTRVVQTELRARWFRRWLGLAPGGKLPETMGEAADLDAREALARFYRLLDEPAAQTPHGIRAPPHRGDGTDRGRRRHRGLAGHHQALAAAHPGRIHRQASGDPLLQRYCPCPPVSAMSESNRARPDEVTALDGGLLDLARSQPDRRRATAGGCARSQLPGGPAAAGGRARRSGGAGRGGAWTVLAVSAAVVVLAGGGLGYRAWQAPRLSYLVEGGALTEGGYVRAGAASEAELAFSDGTRVELGRSSRGRVASIGRARRPGAAGPGAGPGARGAAAAGRRRMGVRRRPLPGRGERARASTCAGRRTAPAAGGEPVQRNGGGEGPGRAPAAC